MAAAEGEVREEEKEVVKKVVMVALAGCTGHIASRLGQRIARPTDQKRNTDDLIDLVSTSRTPHSQD